MPEPVFPVAPVIKTMPVPDMVTSRCVTMTV